MDVKARQGNRRRDREDIVGRMIDERMCGGMR